MSLYQFDCGHVLSISHTGELPDDFPCPSCKSKQQKAELIQKHGPDAIVEWKQQGEWCRRQRHAWYKSLMHQARSGNVSGWDFVAKSLNITKSAVTSMERGDSDPSPLIEFWEKERGVCFS